MEDPGASREDGYPERVRDELHRHLSSLYAVAQVVTLDENEAARLVEQTYRRAFGEAARGAVPGDVKTWLFDLLLALRREQQHLKEPADGSFMEGQPARGPSNAAGLRQRWAEQVVNRLLPVALASLPEDLRAILILCDVEGLPCTDAAHVVDVGPESACVMLDLARERLTEAVRSAAGAAERELLDTALPADWIQAALPYVLHAELPPVPASLRIALEHAGKQTLPASGETIHDPPLPRLHRVRQRTETHNKPAVHGILVAVILIVGTGIVGLLISRWVQDEPQANLITVLAREAEDAEPGLRTDSPVQAEQFIQERLGLRLTLPEIQQARLAGVGVSEIAGGLEIPVFLFEDPTTDRPLVLYVCTYAMLDRHSGRLTLENDILDQIADDEHFDLHDLGTEKALIWRDRDDIFIAITQGDAEALRERIFFPS